MLQVIPLENQPTGLAMLGQTLLNSSLDNQARQRQLEDADRLRAQRLQDVQSQRSYENQQFDKIRNLQLSDEQRKRFESLDDKSKQDALQNRFGMLQEAEKRGLISAADLGNQQTEDAAIKELATQLAKETQFSSGQPGNAQARLAELGQAEQAISQKMSAVEARLSAQPTIDQAQVQNAAIQLATQLNNGKPPSRDQIMASMADAQKQISDRAMTQWYQDKNDAQVQYKILADQLGNIRQQQGDLVKTFHVAPTSSPLTQAAPVMAAPPSAPGGSPMGGFISSLNSELAKRGAPPPSTGDSPSIRDVTTALTTAPASAVPALRQARTGLLADQYATLDQPVNDINSRLADVQQQMTRVQSGLDPTQGVTPGALNVDPQVSGEFLTKLLMQQAALNRQRQLAEQQRQQGKTALLQQLQVNTPSQAIPFSAPSPGGVLSDPYSQMQPIGAGL